MRKTLHISFFLLLVAFCTASSGLILYSHFCSTDNLKVDSITFINHCENDKIELEASCHSETLACHSQEEKDPCCKDIVRFEIQDQIVSTIQKAEFEQLDMPFLWKPFTDSPQPFYLTQEFRTAINPPPPILRHPIINLQRFLC